MEAFATAHPYLLVFAVVVLASIIWNRDEA